MKTQRGKEFIHKVNREYPSQETRTSNVGFSLERHPVFEKYIDFSSGQLRENFAFLDRSRYTANGSQLYRLTNGSKITLEEINQLKEESKVPYQIYKYIEQNPESAHSLKKKLKKKLRLKEYQVNMVIADFFLSGITTLNIFGQTTIRKVQKSQ